MARRLALDVVEDFAVLHAVVRDPVDCARRVEIYGKDLAIDFRRLEERALSLGARNIVVRIAADDGGCRRGGSERHPDGICRHARLDLLEITFLEMMPMLGSYW